mgnify:CR=1 FL=1
MLDRKIMADLEKKIVASNDPYKLQAKVAQQLELSHYVVGYLFKIIINYDSIIKIK